VLCPLLAVVASSVGGAGRAHAQSVARDPAVAAPRVGGAGLGDSHAGVLAALGTPVGRQRSLGLVFWDYPQRGFSLIWDQDQDRVRAIVLRTPAAGPVEGVRVGDSVTSLRARWGTPVRVRQRGRFLDFARQDWTCSFEVARGRVAEITLMRAE
jgi:hypothetical protein